MCNKNDFIVLHTSCRTNEGLPHINHETEVIIRKDNIVAVCSAITTFKNKQKVGFVSSNSIEEEQAVTAIRLKDSQLYVTETYSQVVELLFGEVSDKFY